MGNILLDLEMLVLHAGLVHLQLLLAHGPSLQCFRLTLRRCTALVRSSGVRNHAFVGESGNRNLGSKGIRYCTLVSVHVLTSMKLR